MFRPYRDVRFAKDKTPYKTHQGAFVAAGAGHRAATSRSRARGVRTGAGFYEASSAAAGRDPRGRSTTTRTGAELERIARRPGGGGWDVGGDRLKTTPRGYAAGPPADRAAAAPVADGRPLARLRAGHPHPRAARRGPRRLAGAAPAGGVGRPERGVAGTRVNRPPPARHRPDRWRSPTVRAALPAWRHGQAQGVPPRRTHPLRQRLPRRGPRAARGRPRGPADPHTREVGRRDAAGRARDPAGPQVVGLQAARGRGRLERHLPARLQGQGHRGLQPAAPGGRAATTRSRSCSTGCRASTSTSW